MSFDIRRSVALHAAILSGEAAINSRGDIVHILTPGAPEFAEFKKVLVRCRSVQLVKVKRVSPGDQLDKFVRACALCIGRRGRKLQRDFSPVNSA